MTLRRFDPFGEILRLQRELERLMQVVPQNVEREMEKTLKLAIPLEVYETPKEFVIKAELPGVKKEDVELIVRNNYLIIKAEKKEEVEEDKEHVHVKERIYGKFERVIPLPPDLDTENAKATFKDGILEIRIPKKVVTQERRISIE
jgi:HSP20 family protein